MGATVVSKKSLDIRQLKGSIIRPSNTTAYAAGDVISAVTSNDHFTFVNPFKRVNSGEVVALNINSSASVATKPDLELWLFHTDIVEAVDNTAFIPTDAEMLTCVGVIKIPTGSWDVGLATAGAGGNAFQQVKDLNMVMQLATSNDNTGNNLYGQLVVRNAYVPVSAEVFTIELLVRQD
jgi:hypothetical protein